MDTRLPISPASARLAVLAIRIFRGGKSTLKSDGRSVGAGRILIEGGGRTGILMAAARCAGDAEFKAFLAKLGGAETVIGEVTPAGENWEVQVTLDGLSLEASIGTGLNYRRVKGRDYSPAEIFAVNGVDWGSSLLQGAVVSVKPRVGKSRPMAGFRREGNRIRRLSVAGSSSWLSDFNGRLLE